MQFDCKKHNGIHTAASDKYIYTLINIAHGKYNVYASPCGTYGINTLIAENLSRAEAERALQTQSHPARGV